MTDALLTVAICTRNRAASLRRALVSVADCARPDAPWEVVVVDNGSTDDTASVVTSFESSLPIRLVRESKAGLSNARNAAVHAVRGEYVLWTDDDCVVDREWLAAYASAFRECPDGAVFGGRIIPRFDGNPPAWLTRVSARVATAYAARDLGAAPVELRLEGNVIPFGANYAIRTVEQRRQLYDARLGRGASHPTTVGEESAVMEALLRDGARGRWVPGAVVTHCIPPQRQRLEYLREYFVADGAADEWRRLSDATRDRAIDESDAVLRRRGLVSDVRYYVLRGVGRPEVWIEYLIAASVARGRLAARRAFVAL